MLVSADFVRKVKIHRAVTILTILQSGLSSMVTGLAFSRKHKTVFSRCVAAAAADGDPRPGFPMVDPLGGSFGDSLGHFLGIP